MGTTKLRRLALGLLVALPGCLEVESMEITVAADAAKDRLDVMIVSRGVFSSATSDESLAKDLADLRKCRDVSALPVPGLGVVDFTAQEEDERWKDTVVFLDIEPGAFFLDEQGRLSFYQFLRINRLREFSALTAELGREAWRRQREKASAATKECIDAALRDDLVPIVFDGAGFRVRQPLATEEHRAQQAALWRSLVRDVEKALGEEDGAQRSDATQRGLVQMLRDNDVAAVRYPGYTEYVVGVQGSDVCEYQIRGAAWRDGLLRAFVANEPPPPKVTQALIEAQFAAFRGREARLPKPFAAAKERARREIEGR